MILARARRRARALRQIKTSLLQRAGRHGRRCQCANHIISLVQGVYEVLPHLTSRGLSV